MKIERTTNTDKVAIELARDLITHPNYTLPNDTKEVEQTAEHLTQLILAISKRLYQEQIQHR